MTLLEETPQTNKLLFLDPGHGMGARTPNVYDPGAGAEGFTEAEVVFDHAQTIKHIFNAARYGELHNYQYKVSDEDRFDVPMVLLSRRTKEQNVPLASRDDRALEAGATHLISIHCNAAYSPKATGTETFYADSGDIWWATNVNDAACRALGLRNRGVKSEDESQHKRLAILRDGGKQGKIASCLLELGFITSPGDRAVIVTRGNRIRLAIELLRIFVPVEYVPKR